MIAFRYRRTSYGRSSSRPRSRRTSSSRYSTSRSRSRGMSSSRSRSRGTSSSRYSRSRSRGRSVSSRYSRSRSPSRSVSRSRYSSTRSRSRSASSSRYSRSSSLSRVSSSRSRSTRSSNPFVNNSPRPSSRRRGPRTTQTAPSWVSNNRDNIIGFGLDSAQAGANAWGLVNAENTLSRGNGRSLHRDAINNIRGSRTAAEALGRTPYSSTAASTRYLQTGTNTANSIGRFGGNIVAPLAVGLKTYDAWDRTGSLSQTGATFATESIDAGVGMLSSMAAGAAGGAMFGPWGALGGTILGAGTYLWGQSTGPYQDAKSSVNSSLNDVFSNALSNGGSVVPQGPNASNNTHTATGGSLAYLDYNGLSSRAATQGLSFSGSSQPWMNLSAWGG